MNTTVNTPMKPLTLIKEDFMQNFAELCNNSGLPFFVIESTLKDLLQEIHMASQQQLEADRKRYNEEVSKAGTSNPENKNGD